MQVTARKGSIVVGVDGSPWSRAAMEWATAEAIRRGLPLHLVHSLSLDHLVGSSFGSDVMAEARTQADTLLIDAALRVHTIGRDIPLTTVSTRGYASGALVRASHGASMVVVGARGLGVLSGSALGSVSFQVATHASSPVVVVRHTGAAQPLGRIVVGVDGSASSLHAVDYAVGQAQARGAELLLVHAWSSAHNEGSGPDDRWPSQEAEYERAVSDALAKHARRLPGTAMTQLVVQGHPVKVLVEQSQGADLMVLGCRGVGGFTGLLLGSVSHGVLRRAACPVAILREGSHR